MKKVLIGLVIAVMMTGSGYAKVTIHWNEWGYTQEQLKKGLAIDEIKTDEITDKYRKLCNESIHKGERLVEDKDGNVSFHYKDHIFVVMTTIKNYDSKSKRGEPESHCYVSKF